MDKITFNAYLYKGITKNRTDSDNQYTTRGEQINKTYFEAALEDEPTHSPPENDNTIKAGTCIAVFNCRLYARRDNITCDGIFFHFWSWLHLNTLWACHHAWGCQLLFRSKHRFRNVLCVFFQQIIMSNLVCYPYLPILEV